MSNQLQITGGAKVRSLEGVITGTSGVLSSVPLGGANGVATLDSGGKVPVSQLPSSVVTYLGTWNAATNTPTLTNGTGDAGDMYICNVAGTVNFGAGPITFAVGDWVLYGSGTWQKSNGQNGTVTSVGLTAGGNALTITNSPITTAGNINVGFAGSSTQYIAGDGTLVTFPTLITEAQTLIMDVYNETGATLTKGTVVYINGGHGNLPTVTKALATSDATSAQTYGVVQADITNNNNGHVVVIGSLGDLDTQAYAAGTQLYLSSTTAGAWTSVKQYAPAHLVYVGIVVRSHPTQGVVEVKIQNGFELDELHNVSAQTPSNNQGLFYNSSNSLWENKSIATALGYTPADNSLVVHLAGTETITGDKTFNGGVDFNNALNINNTFNLRNNLVGSTLYTNFSILKSGSLETLSLLFSTAFSSKLVFNDAANYTYTFPAASGNLVLGSGSADSVAYWNSASGLTYDSTFYYSASNKRLGVNTNTPNATIGANIAIDGGYGLLVKNADNNYNGLGIGIDSTYGNLIASQKLGTASARNVTILNQSGYHSLTEAGSFGLNILTPTASPSGVGSVGIDVYGGSNAAGIGFHNVASGVGNTNGAYIYLTNALSLTLRNLEGSIVSSSLGDFSVITNSTENFRVNASNGSLWQSNITSAVLKANSSNVIVAAVAGTDYQAPITLTTTGSSGAATFSSNTLNVPNYTLSGLGGVPTSRTLTINGTAYDLSADRSWSVGTLTGGGADGRVAFWNGASNVVSDSLFVWDDTNNRLGIGLVNPQRALEIYSSSPDTHLRLSGAAPSVSMGEAITGSIYQAKFGLATANNQFVTGSVAGDFVINNQTGSTIWAYNSTEKMRLDTNGNLGVGGIANSSYRLHVFGTGTMLGIETTAASNVYLRMLQAGTVVSGAYYNNSDTTFRIFNNNGGLRFDTSTVNGALTIASTGAATFSSSVSVNGASATTTLNVSSAGANGINLAPDTNSPTTNSARVYFSNNSTAFAILNSSSTLAFTYGATAGSGTGTPGITMNASGNVVIGNTTAYGGLTISDFSANDGNDSLSFYYRGTAGAHQSLIKFYDFRGQVNAAIGNELEDDGVGTQKARLVFKTAYNGTPTERMRIGSDGTKYFGVYNGSRFQMNAAGENFYQYTNTYYIWGLYNDSNNLAIESLFSGAIVFKTAAQGTSSSPTTGTERMRITSGGNVLLTQDATIYNSTGNLFMRAGTSGDLILGSGGSNDKMRITSGGVVCINTSSSLPGANKFSVYNSDAGPTFANATTTQQSLLLWNQGTTGNNLWTEFHTELSSPNIRGSIYYNRGSGVVVYATTSDYRIKSEIEEFNALDIVKNLKPKKFKINDAEQKSYGFIAHELQEFVPQAVVGQKDEIKEDGTPKLQQVDYAQLTGLLAKAIQEQQAQIEELKALINK